MLQLNNAGCKTERRSDFLQTFRGKTKKGARIVCERLDSLP